MNFLITAGGTEEPLDGVRYITNFSTGRTGAALASYLAEVGHKVILLHGYHALLPDLGKLAKEGKGSIRTVRYRTFSDLNREIRQLLIVDESIDAIVHLAAVSDYSPVSISIPGGVEQSLSQEGKLSSTPEYFSIHMKRNHKIIAHLREYAGDRNVVVVGFKLTNTLNQEERRSAVQKLSETADCDLIIHNDLHEIGEGDAHGASIFLGDGTFIEEVTTKTMLFHHIEKYGERLLHEMKRDREKNQ